MVRGHADARHPRTHWVLLVVLLLSLLFFLVVSGFTSGVLGESARAPESRISTTPVPSGVLRGGPILAPSRPNTAGLSLKDRHVALTFDDGPTRYTAEILDVLRREQVSATFFVIGSRVVARPDLVRRMIDEGHQVGVHTFTHVNLANIPPWRVRLELNQTQLAIAAATGRTTNLMRPPFSSQADAIGPSDWKALQLSTRYRVVFTNLDTKDWQRPGTDDIVAAGTPADGAGAVVMLHDGGGNREQTVRAVADLITGLRADGYTFDTITDSVGLPSPWQRATTGERVGGWITMGVVRLSGVIADGLRIAFLGLAILAVLRTALLVMFARRHDMTTRRRSPDTAHHLPSVTVVVPAYNEELGIASAVRSLAASDYPDLEIIVVDDGSTDATASVVDNLEMPGVRLIRQANGGKPTALNTGIAAARGEILVLVDGDTVFEPDAMRALVAPLSDPAVGAVSGNTKVGNRRGLLGSWQHIEYVIGFNLDRRMFDVLQCMPTVPGAIGAFRRETLDAVGGVSSDTLAEDTDLTMAICRGGWRVVYAPDARAWTEAPSTLGQLWRQRYRWCYGTMQSMWKHRHAAVESGASGKLGRRGLPYLLAFQVALPLLAPAIDVAAIYALVFGSSMQIVWVWLAFLAMQYLSAAYAFVLDREKLAPLWTLVLQQLVYRQMMYLVVIQSVASAVYGIRLKWQKLRRTGDMEAAPVGVAT
ncbi:MAG: bifunctional polysaccharide deacetylase/glycosyltransferase family 2 protein [Aeromicrobium sp.]|uniref:bifunctional polysaccharide deacetylase/glycosyltransferase family 2 protein n=1 Tax=Aeromicrobium sp. TaxID=1871063 RepID=UPI003C5ED8E9